MGCDHVDKVCEVIGAHIPTKKQIHLWLDSGGNPPRRYGITSTFRIKHQGPLGKLMGKKDSTDTHQQWLADGMSDLGWHQDGCCADPDYYFVCVKEAGNAKQNQALDATLTKKVTGNQGITNYEKVPPMPTAPYDWTDPNVTHPAMVLWWDGVPNNFTVQMGANQSSFFGNFHSQFHEDGSDDNTPIFPPGWHP
jgi:hypothetical protein